MAEPDLLGSDTVGDYLTEMGIAPRGAQLTVEDLEWSVSNVVLKVSWEDKTVVFKQSMPKLAVAADWSFDRRRTLVERDCLLLLGSLVPGAVPDVIYCDEDRFALVISCVPPGGTLWKAALMAGRVEEAAAGRAGALLGRIHRLSAADHRARERFTDQTVMIQGRTDPYHMTVAAKHPALATAIEREVERMLARQVALTLGDYSPKNLFVYPDHVMAIDFEVAHWGDPAFDVAFCLTHLILKAIHFAPRSAPYLASATRFWDVYSTDGAELAQQADIVAELGCLLLARIDGKSPVEYITDDRTRGLIRGLAAHLIIDGGDSVRGALATAAHAIPDAVTTSQ